MVRLFGIRGAVVAATVLVVTLIGSGTAAADPSLTSAEDNVAYALGAICIPFVLDGTSRESLPLNQRLVHPDGFDALARPNPEAVRVGLAGFVHVTFTGGPGGLRGCDIGAKDADPQSLRKALLAVLAMRPEGFSPTRSKYLPGRFATEDMLCAAADSPHSGAFVLLSATHPEERGRISVLFTLANVSARMESCDHEGVKLNYRTLVGP